MESLSKHPHPCLALENLSIFNSPDVASLRLAREMEYTIDMDGVIVLSKLVLDSHTHTYALNASIASAYACMHHAHAHDITNTNSGTCPPSEFATGEARACTKYKYTVTNMHKRVSKSQLFDTLPDSLSLYEHWLPGFKSLDRPVNSVHVVFRVKSDAATRDIQ